MVGGRRVVMKKLLYIFLISYLLIFCSISRAFENISKKEFNSLLEDKGNLGFVLRYHNEKSPSGYEIKMPKNSPPIIADFKSLYGVLGGSRSFYKGTSFHKKHGGIDFYIEIGSPILAAGDGKVYGVKKRQMCRQSNCNFLWQESKWNILICNLYAYRKNLKVIQSKGAK